MALTEIPIELSSTPSIVDGGNATAITIDSTENVGVGIAPVPSSSSYNGGLLHLHQPSTTTTHGSQIKLSNGVTGSAAGDGFLIAKYGDKNTYLTNFDAGSDIIFNMTNDGGTVAERMRLNHDGIVTMPSQPAFLVFRGSSTQNNIAINSNATVVFASEVFDVGANFASNTFTAPVTGKYHLDMHVRIEAIDIDASFYQLRLISSNRTYTMTLDPRAFDQDPGYHSMTYSVLADMDASDTVSLILHQGSGSAQSDIDGESFFSGHLVA